MKYIKLFEGKWEQPDRTEELLDFTNDYLAYLTDDGFKFQVNSGDFTSDVYEVIRIRKGDTPFYINGGDPNLDKEQFTWDQIKDYMLPYLIMLDRRYTIAVVTFFTERLGSSLSYTREGAARIKDLLDEKRDPHYYNWNSYNNPRSQIFEEIRIKIMRLPISKVEEGFDRWSRDQKNELTEYCETNLAYLMDEGFKIRIGQNLGENTVGKGGKTLVPNPSFHNINICMTKKEREDFFWSEVKDHFIPFVMRIQRKYNIEKIRLLGDDTFHYIKNDFEQELDSQPIRRVSYIDIFLSGEKEQINESLSHKEEIEDFCDTHLAYLTDENFRIRYEEFYGGNVIKLEIGHDYREKEGFYFTWNEVKDRFIPFLQMLSKQYRLHNFHFEDNNCKRTEVVKLTAGLLSKFQSTNSVSYYTYNDIINDDLSPLGGNLVLESIMIKIGRKLI